jgi:ATP-dependent DNA ligase
VCGPTGSQCPTFSTDAAAPRAVLKAFDLLELNGEDLRLSPFEKRETNLARLLAAG